MRITFEEASALMRLWEADEEGRMRPDLTDDILRRPRYGVLGTSTVRYGAAGRERAALDRLKASGYAVHSSRSNVFWITRAGRKRLLDPRDLVLDAVHLL